ncbi:MAG: hypothetical protein ACXAC7_18975 [Candidatus Hodarchaeales archaeon]|jgi:hypothetical protein
MKKFTDDRFLKLAFLIGGIYDLILGINLLIFPDLSASLLNITKTDPEIMSQTNGLFLLAVGYLLIVASQDSRRLAFIGVGSCFVRLSYAFLVVIALITIENFETGYLIVALTDTLTAIIILIPMVLTEGISRKNLWKI